MGLAMIPRSDKKQANTTTVVTSKKRKAEQSAKVSPNNKGDTQVSSGTPKQEKKKRNRTNRKKVEPKLTIEDDQSLEDSDEDEDEILAAAQAWANDGESTSLEPTTAKPEKETELEFTEEYKIYSLHLTQLSYEANEFEIRTIFVEAGCIISSIRLVYDGIGTERTFRGVAFLDVCDEESYKKALTLNRRMLLGRKMNVRPTKTKDELTDIVARTKEIVAAKIKRQKDKQEGKEDPKREKKSDRKDKKKGDKKNIEKEKKKRKKEHVNESSLPSKKAKLEQVINVANGKPGGARMQGTKQSQTGEMTHKANTNKSQAVSDTPKLTKKERNRKAAILMAKRGSK